MNRQEAIAKLGTRFPCRIIRVTESMQLRIEGDIEQDCTINIYRRDLADTVSGEERVYSIYGNSADLATLVERALAEFAVWENKVMGRRCDNCGKKYFITVDGTKCQDMTCASCKDMDSWHPRECCDCRYNKTSVCKDCENMKEWE